MSLASTSTSLSSPPAAIFSHLSPESMDQVFKLINQKTMVETPYLFPISFITLLFILYLLANVLHNWVLPRVIGHKWYNEIQAEHRRTMVIYVLQVVVTSAALICQLAVSRLLKNELSVWRFNVLRAAACLIAALYLFELIYRYRMTYPMIAHHAITCFAISLSLVMLERLQDPSFALTGLLWIFQATTEQTVFIALFLYRLSAPAKVLGPLFRIAAAQSLVFKLASIGGTVWVWVKYQHSSSRELASAWDALFWICTIGLAFCQVWGAWVVWSMGDSLEKRYQMKLQKKEEDQLKQFDRVLPASTSTDGLCHGQSSAESTSTRSSQSTSSDLEKANFALKHVSLRTSNQ